MEFGRKGQFRVVVDGVPFRADGESYDEAQNKILDMLEQEPSLFMMRAKDLGMDENDMEMMKRAFDAGSTGVGDAKFMQSIHGQVRQDMMPTGFKRFLVGSGRSFINHWRGAKQGIELLFGDEEAAKAIAREDKDERDLYQKLDDQGFIGPEDIGEIGTDIVSFLGGTALTGPGILPMMGIGAALAASDVKAEVPVDSPLGQMLGHTQIESGRGLDALVGGVASVAGPIVGKVGGGMLAIGRKAGAAISKRLAPGLWLRARALMGNPTALTNVISDAVNYTAEGSNKGQAILGRAALDKVKEIVDAVPQTVRQGLWMPTALGTVRNAVQKATATGADGVNTFNPAVFEKEIGSISNKLGEMFYKTEFNEMMKSTATLARAMQSLPAGVDVATAERAAAALVEASPNSQAILKALSLATSPGVKQSLIDSLAEKGTALVGNLGKNFGKAAIAGTGENVSTEGMSDIKENISAKQKALRGR